MDVNISKLTLRFHSFKVDEELIKKIVQMLEDERKSLGSDYFTITYEINGKKESFETPSASELIKYGLPKHISQISMILNSTSKNISIYMSKDEAKIDLKSNNTDWDCCRCNPVLNFDEFLDDGIQKVEEITLLILSIS